MEKIEKIYFNPSIEEKYYKYVEQLKKEKEEQEQWNFNSSFMESLFKDKTMIKQKLIELIKKSYLADTKTRQFIDCYREEINSEKKTNEYYTVENLIQSNLETICLGMLTLLQEQNKMLEQNVLDLMLRQPIRIVKEESM